jgi:ketosteroid isomerase-like protein
LVSAYSSLVFCARLTAIHLRLGDMKTIQFKAFAHVMESTLVTTKTVVTAFLQNLAQQNADGIEACFADEIQWSVPGDPALSWVGHRTRGSQVADYFRSMWPHFVTGQSTASVEKLLFSGNDPVLLGTFSHTVVSTRRSFSTPVAMHMQVENGKIVKLALCEDTWLVS